jgi:hypothetical protein
LNALPTPKKKSQISPNLGDTKKKPNPYLYPVKYMNMKATYYSLLLLTLTVLTLNASAQNWQVLGPDDYNQPSYSEASYNNIVMNGTTPYVAFSDNVNGYKLTVSKFNGTMWEIVGTEGFSAGSASDISLVLDPSGTPYVAYKSNDGKANVQKYNGTAWELVGNAGFSAGSATNLKMAIDANGTPYVVYRDFINGQVQTVMKYNGTAWETVGVVSASASSYNNIAIDANDIPYVIYSDSDNSNKATVKKYNGTTWEVVGNAGFSSGNMLDANIIFVGVTPYVSFQDVKNSVQKVIVMKYNGTTWETVGGATVTAGRADYNNLTADASGNLYLIYKDYSSSKTIVQKYNGTTWDVLATVTTSLSVIYTDIAIATDGTPYVVYSDTGYGYKATVQKYNGTAWEKLGVDVSAIYAGQMQMTTNTAGTPYVFYQDGNSLGKTTVIKHNGTAWETVGAPGFSTSISSNSIDIAIATDGTPYVCFRNGSLYTYKYDGTNWVAVGSPISTNFSPYPSIACNGNVPYIAYRISGGKASVQKYNGTDWELVGINGFTSGSVFYLQMAINTAGVPYVVFDDGANTNKATVMKYNGTAWELVGTAGFSAGSVNDLDIKFNPTDDTPYVSYRDNNSNDKATVMKFNGTAWELVGTAGFSVGAVKYTSLLFVGNTPYISYQDAGNGNKAMVQKFNGITWEMVGTMAPSAGATLYPALAYNGSQLFSAYNSGFTIFAKTFALTTLPVKLTAFEASVKSQNQVGLNWQTASENNNSYFTLAKSKDGKTFAQLSTVKSKGENGASYSTVDFSPFAGINYYRLSQTDINGKTEVLGIRSVKLASLKETGISVYPNPVVNGFINIQSQNLNGLNAVSLYDLSGKEIISGQVDFVNGLASYKLPLVLTKGVYVLAVADEKLKIILE